MLKGFAKVLAVGSLCGGFAIGVTSGLGCDDTSGNCPANAVGGRSGSGGEGTGTGTGGKGTGGGSAGGGAGHAGGMSGSAGGNSAGGTAGLGIGGAI